LSNLIHLIFNEQIKIYIRKSTWVMYALILLLVLGIAFIEVAFETHEVKSFGDDWKTVLKAENEKLLKEQEEFERKLEEGDYEYIFQPDMDQYEINSFYLAENIKPVKFGAWQFVHGLKIVLSIISLFTIIVAANIVSSEHRWGTIKLLLIRPISRSTIILSKYLSVLLFAFITAIFLFIVSFLTGALFFGIESGLNPHSIVYDYSNSVKGQVVSENAPYLKYVSLPANILANYGYHMVILIMMATLALMISTIFKNNALAIGVAIFLMFAGNSIVAFFSEHSWAKYILFANLDLSQHINNSPLFEGMTLPFSLTILLLHYIIFIGIAWIVFVKRDVTE